MATSWTAAGSSNIGLVGSKTSLYTVPANTESSINWLNFSNDTGGTLTVNVEIVIADPSDTVNIVDTESVDDTKRFVHDGVINMRAGDILKVWASGANMNVYASIIEKS